MRKNSTNGGRCVYRRLRLVTAVAGLASLIAACSFGGADERNSASGIPSGDIKLGAIFTTTGPTAAYAQTQIAELNLSLRLINDSGGIAGHHVTLDIQDDGGNPTQAAQAALKLVSDGIAAVVYPGIPDSELQSVPVFSKHKVPVISTDYGQMANASRYPYLFATWPALEDQAVPVATYAQAHGWSKIAIFGDGSTFGNLQVDAMKSALTAKGLTTSTVVTYSPTATDVSSQITQAKNSGANTIAVVATTGQGAVWSGLHATGWDPHIITLGTSRYIGADRLGSFASTAIMPCTHPIEIPGKELSSNLADYMKGVHAALPKSPAATFDTAPDYWLAPNVIKLAIEQASSTDPDGMKAALETWQDKVVTDPDTPISYSATDHEGRSAPDPNVVCSLNKIGKLGLDVPFN